MIKLKDQIFQGINKDPHHRYKTLGDDEDLSYLQ